MSGERINTVISPNESKPSTPYHESHHDSFENASHSHHTGSSDYDYDTRKRGGTTIYISFNDISHAAVREILEPYGPILNIRIDEKKWQVISLFCFYIVSF